MNPFPQMSNEQIDAIFDYVDAWTPPVAVEGPGDVGSETGSEDSSSKWIWYVIAALSIIVIIYVGSVKRQLSDAIDERDGVEDAPKTLSDRTRAWAWKNRVFVGIGGLVVLIIALAALLVWGNESVGIYQGYKPSQPIDFSHKIHAGQYKIDCNYCHTGVRKSKNANIPSPNICMNCHSSIKTDSPEIKKIYDAVENNEPIEWVRIHNLPDLAYFNHSQHVSVAGVECQTCHGPVEEMEIMYQYSPLTMGWCINCHRETNVKVEGNAYYEKIHAELSKKYGVENLTAAQMGGLECGKCHY